MIPDWAEQISVGVPGRLDKYAVSADLAYPALLEELGFTGTPTQYDLEVAYQCIKMEMQRCLGKFSFELSIRDPDKNWAQKKHKKGKGADAATKGREARAHYKRIRGFVPA